MPPDSPAPKEIGMKFYSWHELDGHNWHTRPFPFPGVYAIYDSRNELVYIGSAMNLLKRISHAYHNAPKCGYKLKVRYTKFVGEWAFREIRLIRRLKPLLNKQKYQMVKL
jgi:predicted GIY-YIG superfamily endonuclease